MGRRARVSLGPSGFSHLRPHYLTVPFLPLPLPGAACATTARDVEKREEARGLLASALKRRERTSTRVPRPRIPSPSGAEAKDRRDGRRGLTGTRAGAPLSTWVVKMRGKVRRGRQQKRGRAASRARGPRCGAPAGGAGCAAGVPCQAHPERPRSSETPRPRLASEPSPWASQRPGPAPLITDPRGSFLQPLPSGAERLPFGEAEH